MAGNQKFPSDLLLVAGLVILTDIFVLIPVLSGSLIRTALGLPLILFLPGYALIAMIAQGPKVEEFELAFSEYTGCEYGVAVSSGTAALHVSLLAHDIDVIYPEKIYTIIGTAKAFAKGNLTDAIKTPFCRICKKFNPCWNFREIMELEAKYNAKSSFYFLALRPGEKDFNYEIEDLEAELKFISTHGLDS